MGQTFSLGRISGIRIGVNWSVLLIVALLAYGLAVGEFPAAAPRHPVAEYVAAALVTAVAYIGSLLATNWRIRWSRGITGCRSRASRCGCWAGCPGCRVRSRTREPRSASPGSGRWSACFGGAFSLLAWLLHAAGVGGVAVAALAWLGGINVLLAVFNVDPGCAAGWRAAAAGRLVAHHGRPVQGRGLVRPVGQVFGWALVVVAAYLVLVRREYNWLWFALLGWFLISAATRKASRRRCSPGCGRSPCGRS